MNNLTDDKRREKVNRILSGVYNLPALPFIVMEVSRMIEDPKTNATKLGEVLKKDQGLVTKILTVANSPLYGIPRRVLSIEFAIVILGYNHIKNIVIALSMMDALKTGSNKKFDQRKFWLHSIMTATASKKLADDLGYRTSGEAFTMGLLHDLGIPVIFKYFSKEYDNIINLVQNENYSVKDAELEVLGVTHEEIGIYLIEKWNLPKALSDVVGNHHHPSKAEENKFSAGIIHLADFMTHKFEIGNFFWDENMTLDEELPEILKMGDMEYVENFINGYEEIFRNQIESLNF